MGESIQAEKSRLAKPMWFKNIARYQQPDLRKALWQLANTLLPYFILLYLMVRMVQAQIAYGLILLLAVLAAGLLVRIFIIFHDCTHHSFFAQTWANTLVGYITGILTFTAYEDWRRTHLTHHASAGNLDRRGVGDVWTMTVQEYQTAPRKKQLAYQFFRNPLVMFGLGPTYMFLIAHRFPSQGASKKERYSVYLTDLALLAIVVLAGLTMGLRAYVLVQLPIIIIAATMGLWLFYVQHQFEKVYWARHETWDPLRAALEGCSYYKLPKILQWFTGNIGLHHIHHARARIPNYNLQQCYDETPTLQEVEPLTLRTSLKSLRMNLWDEDLRKMVSFRTLKRSQA